MKTICEQCGTEVSVGDWPFCHGDKSAHVKVGKNFHDGFEPYLDEHLTTDPVWIASRSERQALMRQNAMEYRPKAKPLGSTLYFDRQGR